MLYIIDGNNLAGRMGIIKEKDFDKKIITLVKGYINLKKRNIVLVFDTASSLGDKYKDGGIIIYYAKTADDKIIELLNIYYNNWLKEYHEIVAITDDNDLAKEINYFSKVKVEPCRDFIAKLNSIYQTSIEPEDDKKMTDREIKEINDDLYDLWVKK